MGKSPAFQFYVNDWLSSPIIMLMSPAEEGAYIRLLSIAWNSEDCGLPDDDKELSILSRLNEGWFNGGSTILRKCFIKKGDRLYNKRLLEERKKQEEWRVKSVEGGIKSGRVRKNSKLSPEGWLKGGCEMVRTKREPKGNSSSSSSNKKHIGIFKLSDEEFDQWIKKEFSYLDLEEQNKKMDRWFILNPDRKRTRRFIVKWLDRADRPVTDKPTPTKDEYEVVDGRKG